MQWLNEPASWQRTGDVLRVSVDPGTDFWRTTGYGYVHDNGHVYGELLPGDLDVSVRVRGAFANPYDQAGVMLRADAQTWLKTGLEFFEGRPRLSTVLTMGCSSWMVADLPPGTDEVSLRVSRRGDAVEVRYTAGDGPAELAALVFLPPDREMLAGIVCAAPEGSGFSAAFHDLRVVGRDWAGQGAADGTGWIGEPAAPAADWAEEQAADGASWAGGGSAGWAEAKAEDEAVEAAGWAGETRSGVPAGWGAAPDDDHVDWAKPQASEPAEDWDRLSLSVSTSWNAFAAAAPADEPPEGQEEEPAQEPPADGRAAKDGPGGTDSGHGPGTGNSEDSKDRADTKERADTKGRADTKERADDKGRVDTKERADGTSGADSRVAKDGEGGSDGADSTGGPPRSPADDNTEPVPPGAGQPPASAEQGEPEARERNGRGRNKAKPSPPDLPVPADPADEWISMLTADSTDELPGPERTPPGVSRTGAGQIGGEPGPAHGERRRPVRE